MMCRDEHTNGIYQYQVQALENILEAPGVLPISFGLQRKETDRPIVFIHKRADGKTNVVSTCPFRER